MFYLLGVLSLKGMPGLVQAAGLWEKSMWPPWSRGFFLHPWVLGGVFRPSREFCI